MWRYNIQDGVVFTYCRITLFISIMIHFFHIHSMMIYVAYDLIIGGQWILQSENLRHYLCKVFNINRTNLFRLGMEIDCGDNWYIWNISIHILIIPFDIRDWIIETRDGFIEIMNFFILDPFHVLVIMDNYWNSLDFLRVHWISEDVLSILLDFWGCP